MAEKKDWADIYYQDTSDMADRVIEEAYAHSHKYVDAVKYIRRIERVAFGDVPDKTAHASMRIFELVCELAISKIREQAQEAPIPKEDQQ